MENEIWKDVIGWEGTYRVSNMGRVLSIARTTIYKDGRKRYINERILIPKMSEYYNVGLFHPNKKSGTYKVHKLVAEAFIGVINGMQVDHINRDKTDNRSCNLRYVSRSNNLKNVGLRSTNKSGLKGVSFCEKRKKWVAQTRFNKNKKWLGYFSSKEEAFKKIVNFEKENIDNVEGKNVQS